jgi:Ala-tRNA(Pro) deacylase
MDIPYQVTRHHAVFTIEDMENLQMEHIEKVAKNLFVRDDKKRNYYLLVVHKDKSANLKEVQLQIGSRRLSFASEDDLARHLGLSKGEVTPFGVLNDRENIVKVFVDRDILSCDFIGIHPNDNTATVWISIKNLAKVLKSANHEVSFITI